MVSSGRFSTLFNELEMVMAILGHGHPKLLIDEVMRRIYSEDTYYGLRRDMFLPFEAPEAKMPIRIRPLREQDIPKLLEPKEARKQSALKDHLQRLFLLRSELPTCYVAVTGEDEPCYMQWMMGPQDNASILSYFRGGFPPLGPDEMLLEGAYTPAKYRGLGIMPCAMAKIAEQGRDFGARRIITFVRSDNETALKGCKRAGFLPFTIRTAQWRYFKRRLNFIPLSPIPGGNIVSIPKVFRSGQ
jgi:GNAT superfamily N-acetyltransferase